MSQTEENKTIWNLDLPSLHRTFTKQFMFGNIVSPRDFDDSELMEMIKHHYNAITAENAMKPVYITSSPGVYDFENADKIVGWAVENKISLIGHTLIWHGQSAPWLNKKPDGSPLTRAEAVTNMEAFIKEYVSRYSGKVYSWDVINEAFRDEDGEFKGNWRDYLRGESENPRAVGHWYLAYSNGAKDGESGGDFVFDAFRFARKYDPKAVLYYNEYNEEQPVKREAIAQMTEEINEEWKNHPDYDGRLLIEGIGMQCHYNHLNFDPDLIRKAIERFAKTGARIAATELDITFGSSEVPAVPITAEQTKSQAEMYTSLFRIFMEYSEHIERVTFWGKNDVQSWRSWGSPTLFHGDGRAKESFHKITALKLGKTLKVDCPCANRDCPRHGDCAPCRESHAKRESLPGCER